MATTLRTFQTGLQEITVEHTEKINFEQKTWKKGKDPHPQDKSQYLDFSKDPRPLYYKTPRCVFYHKNVRSKAVFGP